jgi:hypothetical protein
MSDDLARRFLAAATALAPASRRDWGRAMLAELDQVTGRRARWRFTLGAAYVSLLPPRSRRRAAIVLTAIAIAAALAIHAEVPRAGAVALIVLPGLPALCAWVALARPRRPGPAGAASPAARAVQVIAAAAIIAGPVLGVRLLTLYPGNFGATNLPGQIALVLFAAEIAVFLLLVIRRPEPLDAGRYSGLLGLAGALAIGGVYLYGRLHSQPDPGLLSPFAGVTIAALLTAAAMPFAVGALAALAGAARRDGFDRCLQLGAADATWTALLTGPAAFIVFVLTTSRAAVAAQAADHGIIILAHQEGATGVRSWVASNNLGLAIILLTAITVVAAVVFLMARFGFAPAAPDLRPDEPGPFGEG